MTGQRISCVLALFLGLLCLPVGAAPLFSVNDVTIAESGPGTTVNANFIVNYGALFVEPGP